MLAKGYTSTSICLRLVHMDRGRKNTAAFTKCAISIALLLSIELSPGPPLEVPQVSLRDPLSIASLRSERSVHHSEWILSVLLPEDQCTTAKQNKTEKGKKIKIKITHYMDGPPPQSHLCPPEKGMLDQFVIQQAPSPSLKAPLKFGFLHPNPVLRLLKVHAAAHSSVCSLWNFCYHTLLFNMYPSFLLPLNPPQKIRYKHYEHPVWVDIIFQLFA